MNKRTAIKLVAGLAGITVALATYQSSQAGSGGSMPPAVKKIFDSKPCFTCHKMGKLGQGVLAPNLRAVGSRRSKTWIKAWLKNPPAVWGKAAPPHKAATAMPPGLLTDAEIDVMANFLVKQRRSVHGTKIIKKHGGNTAAAGKALFAAYDCGTCHKVGGRGGNLSNTGPDLKGEFGRRGADWLKKWLANPQKVKKGTFMPNFKLSSGEIDALIAYMKAN